MNTKNYDWKRFWCPRGELIDLSDGGFLYYSESEYSFYVQQNVLPFKKIATEPCLVLLGEPGIGKSTEIIEAVKTTKSTLSLQDEQLFYLNLNQYSNETRLIEDLFETSPIVKRKIDGTPLFIFLDSLDECKLRIDTVSEILSQKFEEYYYDKFYLRIACRTAEWSNYLESKLNKIWGERKITIYELSPLRKKDVEVALTQNEIDLTSFFEQIYMKDVQPLAMKPITLNFLINIFSSYNVLPNTRKELYEKGIKLLIEEPNASRKESKSSINFSSNQKIVTAERIAALMVFCNKSSILMNSNEMEINPSEILIEEFTGGKEIVESCEIEINEQLVRDVISTGLFTLRDKDRMGWAHQTYAEFLAAKYVVRNQFNENQIFSLILNSSYSEIKIIPQLNETVGWLATLIPLLFKKLMDIDPEVLLKSDVTLHDDIDKERLVENLLRLFDEQKLFDLNYSFRKYYHKLNHSKLPDQLKPFIIDKLKNWLVRHEAIDIAETCKLLELQGELLQLFGDKSDSLSTRSNAGWALYRIADDDYRKMMKKFLFEDLSEDKDDELKGLCLMILWPKFLTTTELFTFLEKPKNSHLVGNYYNFIYQDPIKYLDPIELPIALEWVAKQDSKHNLELHGLEKIIDSIMYLGWQNLGKTNVLPNFVKAVKHLFKNYDEIISKNKHKFYDELLLQDSKRRLLIKSIFESFSDALKEVELFYGVNRQIAFSKDFGWMLERAIAEHDVSKKRAWSILARYYFNISDQDNRDLLIIAAHKDNIIFEEFRYYLEPIELDSEKAKKEKETYIKYFKPNRFDEKRVLFKIAWQEKIFKLIQDLREGSTDVYWLIHLELCKDPEQKNHFSELQSDITILPGWKFLEPDKQQLIIEASKEYLLRADPKDNEWLGQYIFHRPAISGYKAIRLLTNSDLEFIEQLNTTIWEKWAATIIAYPVNYGFEEDQYHERILAFAYQKAPIHMLNAFKILLDKECTKDEYIFITKRFKNFWNENISEIVIKKIQDKETKPNSFSSLLEDFTTVRL